MVSKYVIAVYLLVCSSRLYGQSPDLEISSFGSGPFVSINESQWSLFRNMAGLANSESWQVMIGYYNPYNLKDLQSLSWGIILPLKVVLGASVFQSGGHEFRNQQLAVNTAMHFNRLHLGLRVKYWRLSFVGFQRLNGITIDLGLQLRLTEKLVTGTYLSNITQSRIGNDQILPVIWATGLYYQPSSKLALSFEAVHRLAHILELKFGTEYFIKEKLVARTGFNTSNRQSYFGVIFNTSKVELDYAISLHLQLGVIHQAGLTFSW